MDISNRNVVVIAIITLIAFVAVIIALAVQNDSVRDKLTDESMKWFEKKAELESDIKRLNIRERDLMKEIDGLRNEKISQDANFRSAVQDKFEVENLNEQLRKNLDALTIAREKDSLAIETLILDLKKRGEEIDALQKKLTNAGLTTEEKADLIAELEGKIDNLRKQLTASNRQIEIFVTEKHNLNLQVEDLKRQLGEGPGNTGNIPGEPAPEDEAPVKELPVSLAHMEGVLFPYVGDWIAEFPERISVPENTTFYVYRGVTFIGKVEAVDVGSERANNIWIVKPVGHLTAQDIRENDIVRARKLSASPPKPAEETPPKETPPEETPPDEAPPEETPEGNGGTEEE